MRCANDLTQSTTSCLSLERVSDSVPDSIKMPEVARLRLYSSLLSVRQSVQVQRIKIVYLLSFSDHLFEVKEPG